MAENKENVMTGRLRVGIVGASADGQGWAPISHFPALRTLPDFEIAAICTAHADTAAAAAKVYGVERAYHDYNAMVQEPNIDPRLRRRQGAEPPPGRDGRAQCR